MSEKVLTFEEWAKKHCIQDELNIKEVFEDARQGMIPAENAVAIPPVSEWPEDADYVALFWYNGHVGIDEGETAIKLIPRPKPVWTPKAGEAVFTNGDDGEGVLYAVVTEVVTGEGVRVTFPDGDYGLYDFDRVKPGNMKYFGKPWSEIPGGVE